jgi:hypothetical protein
MRSSVWSHVGALTAVWLLACCPAPAAAASLPPSGTIDLAADADATLLGAADGDSAGWAVAPAGDVNGDGRPDLLVGAPRTDPLGRADAGSVYVMFGPAAGLPAELGTLGGRGYRIDGASAGDRAGTAVAAAGDVDCDGFGDVLVGAPQWSERAVDGPGAAYLVRGRAGADSVDLAVPSPRVLRMTTGGASDQTGMAIASAPDMDGDRRPEVLVGAPRVDGPGRTDAGAAFVVFSSRLTGDVDLSALGDRGLRLDGVPGSRAGLGLAGVADMNGDGRGEVAVGAPALRQGSRLTGGGYIVFGRAAPGGLALSSLGAAGFPVVAAPADGFLGLAVAAVGDVTADGLPDVAFGGPASDRNERPESGSAYVIAGRATSDAVALADPTGPALRVDGAANGDRLGAALAPAGDVTADGRGDRAIGTPFAAALSRTGAGAVYVVSGAATGTVDTASLGAQGHRIAGADADARLWSVAGMGDLDGDGVADLVAGAPGGRRRAAAGAGPATGAAYVVLGPRPAPAAAADPGVLAEVQAGCRAARNVEFLIDDSGSMLDSDPQILRRQAVELLVSKPRNTGEILGAFEFGSEGDQVFPPQVIAPRGAGSNQLQLFQLLDRLVRADNEGTDYNAAFTGVANDNPAAEARIFLTDGEHNEGEYANGHRGGPPTYVIGLGIGRRGDAAARLQRIADDTRGRYFPGVNAQRLQEVVDRIDSRLNCDIALDSEVDVLTDDERVAEQEVGLDDDARSYDVEVSWGDDADSVVPDGLVLSRADGRRIAAFGPERLARILRRPGRTFRSGAVSVRAHSGDTFFGLRLAGARGARLRISYRMTRFAGRGARVTSQVMQSRRRR